MSLLKNVEWIRPRMRQCHSTMGDIGDTIGEIS
jgi:hypothetical protein